MLFINKIKNNKLILYFLSFCFPEIVDIIGQNLVLRCIAVKVKNDVEILICLATFSNLLGLFSVFFH